MLAASEAELQRLKRDDPELVSEYQSTKGFDNARFFAHFRIPGLT